MKYFRQDLNKISSIDYAGRPTTVFEHKSGFYVVETSDGKTYEFFDLSVASSVAYGLSLGPQFDAFAERFLTNE